MFAMRTVKVKIILCHLPWTVLVTVLDMLRVFYCFCCVATKPVQRTLEMLLFYRCWRPDTSYYISGEIKVDMTSVIHCICNEMHKQF